MIFLIGSLLCGLSQEMWQFILFRGVQGLGAGALFLVALAIIGDIFAPSERGKYQGFFGAVFGLSSVIGPAIGGIITDTIGWHWIFFVNLPLGAVVLADLADAAAPHGGCRGPFARLRGRRLLTGALVPILVGFYEQADRRLDRPDRGRADRPRVHRPTRSSSPRAAPTSRSCR